MFIRFAQLKPQVWLQPPAQRRQHQIWQSQDLGFRVFFYGWTPHPILQRRWLYGYDIINVYVMLLMAIRVFNIVK